VTDGDDGMQSQVWSSERRVLIHERHTHRALFGIRFWEHGFDQPVEHGLVVTAHAIDADGARSIASSPVRAIPNPEGTYVFHRLPSGGVESPPSSAGVAIEVRDRLERFLPVVYTTADPMSESEIFLTPDGQAASPSPPGGGDPRFYLFSSPTRHVNPRAAASVRVQLWDREADAPAAYAVLEVEHDGETWYGLANERGSALVAFPYPPATPSLAGSPPPAAMAGLYEQSWELEVRVRYSAGEPLSPLPGFGLPDLGDIVGQPYARIVPAEEGLPVDSVPCLVVYGRESTLRTGGMSVLWI